MRIIFSLVIASLSLHGCVSRSTSTETETAAVTDSVTEVASESPLASADRCYRQVIGRDTTRLRLVINGSTVTGELAVLPFEKDKARGSIQGTLANNQIKADWQRLGEGTTQPYEVVFTMKGDSIMWREGERVEKQGKWVLQNPEQGYQYVLAKSECP